MAALGGGGGAAANAIATVTIYLEDGQLTARIARITGGMQRAARQTDAFSNTFRTLNSAAATVSKALLSMFGVLVAFNLFITLPQQIIRGIAGAISYALTSFSEFEQGVIGLKAILATAAEFSSDATENFRLAGDMALVVNDALLEASVRTAATFEQMQQAFQVFAGAGGLEYVKNMREAVDLVTLLTNTILPLTVGQMNKTAQIATELRAVLEGREPPGASLANYLQVSSDRFKNILATAREQKNLLEVMTKLLQGFSLASVEYEQSLEGIKTTYQTIAGVLARDIIKPMATALAAAAKNFHEQLRAAQTDVNLLTSLIGAVLLTAVQSVMDSLEEGTVGIIPKLQAGVMDIALSFVRTKVEIQNIWANIRPLLSTILDILKVAASFLFNIGGILVDFLVSGSRAYREIMRGNLGEANRIADAFLSNTETKLGALNITIGEAANSIVETYERGIVTQNAELAVAKARIEIEKNRAAILAQMTADQARNKGLLDEEIRARMRAAELTKEQQRYIREADEFLQSLGERYRAELTRDDPIMRVHAEITKLIDDAYKKTSKIPPKLQEAYEWIVKIRDVMMERAGAEVLERDVRNLLDRLQKAAKQADHIAKLQRELAAAKRPETPMEALNVARIQAINAATIEFADNADLLQLALLLINERFAELRGTELFKQYIDSIRVAIDDTRRLDAAMSYTITKMQLAARGAGAFTGAGAGLPAIQAAARARITENQIALDEIQAMKATAVGEAYVELVEQERQYIAANEQLNISLFETNEQVLSMILNVQSLSVTIPKLVMAMLKLGDGLKTTKELVADILVAAITEFILGIVKGGESLLQMIRRLFGQIIIMIGTTLIQLGVASLIGSWLGVIGLQVFGSPAAALKAIAIGAAIVALGSAIAGRGAGATKGAGGGGGGGGGKGGGPTTQTIYLEPYYQLQQNQTLARIDDTLSHLNSNLSRMDSMPTGALVVDGINKAGTSAAVAMTTQIGKSRDARVGLSTSILEGT